MWARSAHLEPSPGAFCLLFRHGKRRSPPGAGCVRRKTYLWRRNSPARQNTAGRRGHTPECPLSAFSRFTFSPSPTRIQSGPISLVGADPRPVRGRPHRAAPTTETGPRALAEKTQARKLDRTSRNFCEPRAQWPGRNRTQALLILRAGNFAELLRKGPRKRGSGGKANMSAERSS